MPQFVWWITSHSDHFLPFIAAGQAALSEDSLAWLRTLPGELTLDCARPHDVYVCHSMPGDPFSGIRRHPLVPPRIAIYGYMYDVKTGRLEEIPDAIAAGRPS